MRRLHVVIPFYNEQNTLEPCVRRVLAAPLPDGWQSAIYLVDDASDEPAAGAAAAFAGGLRAEGHAVSLRRHDVNRGKGAAVRGGFDAVLAANPPDDDLVIIQDADLEYDPADFPRLMEPIVAGRAEAVVGTRWGDHRSVRGLKHTLHAWANGAMTRLSNLMTGCRLRDMECCYKLMTVGVLRRLRPMLSEDRFGIEPQIVAGWSRLKVPIAEAPISYDPRAASAGKKIRLSDGVEAVRVLVRERARRHRP